MEVEAIVRRLQAVEAASAKTVEVAIVRRVLAAVAVVIVRRVAEAVGVAVGVRGRAEVVVAVAAAAAVEMMVLLRGAPIGAAEGVAVDAVQAVVEGVVARDEEASNLT